MVIIGLVNEIRKNWRGKSPDKIKTVAETVEDKSKYIIYLGIQSLDYSFLLKKRYRQDSPNASLFFKKMTQKVRVARW